MVKILIINSSISAQNIKRCWACGLVILSLAALLGCQQEINVPRQLIGVWRTSAPKYMDRYIEFTNTALIFGIGNDEKTVHVVKKIKFKPDHFFLRVYTFYYQDPEGEKSTLSLTLNPYYDGGAFQLQNHKEYWERRS